MQLYLDANAIIYAIEGIPAFRAAALAYVIKAEQMPDGEILTSRLSRMECRVRPLRDGNQALLEKYDLFLTRSTVRVLEMDAAVVERATELRALHGFKTPDALHLATAIVAGADVFLTGDGQLARCNDVRVEILRP